MDAVNTVQLRVGNGDLLLTEIKMAFAQTSLIKHANMKGLDMRKFSVLFILLASSNASAYTECVEKIANYFVGTSIVNQTTAHLYVNFEGGGSASISSESAAYEALLSSVITAIVTNKQVKVRYFTDGVDCKIHHGDWVGMWSYSQ